MARWAVFRRPLPPRPKDLPIRLLFIFLYFLIKRRPFLPSWRSPSPLYAISVSFASGLLVHSTGSRLRVDIVPGFSVISARPSLSFRSEAGKWGRGGRSGIDPCGRLLTTLSPSPSYTLPVLSFLPSCGLCERRENCDRPGGHTVIKLPLSKERV